MVVTSKSLDFIYCIIIQSTESGEDGRGLSSLRLESDENSHGNAAPSCCYNGSVGRLQCKCINAESNNEWLGDAVDEPIGITSGYGDCNGDGDNDRHSNPSTDE